MPRATHKTTKAKSSKGAKATVKVADKPSGRPARAATTSKSGARGAKTTGSKTKAPGAADVDRDKTRAARTGAVKARRLSLRVEDKDRALFDRAADTNRETLTQFLVAGGRERAERLLADRTRFRLSPDAWDELVAVMDRDARPNPQLARLFSRRSSE